LLLLLTAAEVPAESGADTGAEGGQFDPAVTARGEFFGFFLLSTVGAMLCAGADDLVWLFLALELTSLPTYVMVATSRHRIIAQEAGVKYFYLGAFAAAIFLYGFALIYGATGTTMLPQVAESVQAAGGAISPMLMIGLVLAVVGIGFKIAAFPMHGYVADVYQGAATPITAFLAFVPKAAGFASLLALLWAVGWPLDRTAAFDGGDVLAGLLWWVAVLTMCVGNTLALLQSNIKRVLACSSIAHSGYMLVGLLVGPGKAPGADAPTLWISSGVGAMLFYLVTYGVMNVGAFAVLGLLKRDGDEVDTFDDLSGLARRRPGLAAVLALCLLSLAGIPPLVGFFGKLYLFGAAINAGHIGLAVVGVVNSAVAAYYYLRMIAACYLADPSERTLAVSIPSRGLAAFVSAALVVVLLFLVGPLLTASYDAGIKSASRQSPSASTPSDPVPNVSAQPRP
jgi:NADH-quinone oxidoreductase subunit N